jgi:RimJ/RimL family protein N-acetyltransferase
MRPPAPEDFEAYADMWAEPSTARYTTGAALTRPEAWSKFLRDVGHWTMLGFGYWSLIELETKRYCGQLGFANFERGLNNHFDDEPEMGWVLAPHARGQGFAQEAARAALAWGAAQFGQVRSVCVISEENIPSLKLAAAIGFRACARAEYKGLASTILDRVL